MVYLRRHLITKHSQKNERMPVSKVEALMQASKHGKETSGGKVANKNKDGSVRVNECQKTVCPICESVTLYLTTHLQRVHKLEKGSDAYNEAIKSKRKYLGRRKEVRRVQRGIKMTKTKKRSAKKNPPPEDTPEDKQPSPRKAPLQILVEEATLMFAYICTSGLEKCMLNIF